MKMIVASLAVSAMLVGSSLAGFAGALGALVSVLLVAILTTTAVDHVQAQKSRTVQAGTEARNSRP